MNMRLRLPYQTSTGSMTRLLGLRFGQFEPCRKGLLTFTGRKEGSLSPLVGQEASSS
jgi:hypothetical protein